jgi:hypothetical protein
LFNLQSKGGSDESPFSVYTQIDFLLNHLRQELLIKTGNKREMPVICMVLVRGTEIAIAIRGSRSSKEKYMNTNKLRQTIKTVGLAFSLVFGIGLLSATTASAQNRDDRDYRQDDRRDRRDDRWEDRNDRYDNNRSSSYRSAMQQGFREGMQSGREDARSNRRENAMKAYNRAVRNARRNYNSRYGSQVAFTQAFREGFMRGYNEGYDRVDDRRDRRGW